MPQAKKPAAKKAPEPHVVDEFSLDVQTDKTVLTIDGNEFELDPHRVLALAQGLSGAAANYVY